MQYTRQTSGDAPGGMYPVVLARVVNPDGFYPDPTSEKKNPDSTLNFGEKTGFGNELLEKNRTRPSKNTTDPNYVLPHKIHVF